MATIRFLFLAPLVALFPWLAAATGAGAGEVMAPPNSPVALNGPLHISGTALVNAAGRPIQLRGMSTHGIQWYGWGNCITPASLDALAQDWRADLLRISMYIQEDGYETDPEKFTAEVEKVADEAIRRGLYVIIDWHMLKPGDPMVNSARAQIFFARIAERFARSPNVIYEIANEPSGNYRGSQGRKHRVDWLRIKAYAEQLIPVIRQRAPEAVVLVGTPDWSSLGVSGDFGPEEILGAPLQGRNLMYTFHFYAADHGAKYRMAVETASATLPLFVSEWGTQNSAGEGKNDFVSAQAWLDLLARKKISWANWNYSDDKRSGAVFKRHTAPNGPWTGSSLKESGVWVQEKMRAPAGYSKPRE